MFDMANFLSAMFGSGVVAAVVFVLLRDKLSQIPQLKRDLTDLRDDRVAKLAGDVDRLKESGCAVGKAIGGKLDHANGMLGKLDAKLDRIAEATSKQAAEIEANRSYIGNLDTSLQRHKESHRG